MAVISLDNKASIAYKNISNKSMTYDGKGLGNEEEGIFFNIRGIDVFVDSINTTPSSAVTAGILEYVQADLVADTSSAGHAYFATYPTGHPKVGQRVRNAISPAHGADYEAKPFASASPISVGDDRIWVYQYNSGIFFQQDNTFATPTTINIYVYIGKSINDLNYGDINFAFDSWTGMSSYLMVGNGYNGMIATCTQHGYDGKIYISSGATWVTATGGGGGSQTLHQTLQLGNDASGITITNLPMPLADTDAATKIFVEQNFSKKYTQLINLDGVGTGITITVDNTDNLLIESFYNGHEIELDINVIDQTTFTVNSNVPLNNVRISWNI